MDVLDGVTLVKTVDKERAVPHVAVFIQPYYVMIHTKDEQDTTGKISEAIVTE